MDKLCVLDKKDCENYFLHISTQYIQQRRNLQVFLGSRPFFQHLFDIASTNTLTSSCASSNGQSCVSKINNELIDAFRLETNTIFLV